ncbi:50S ribosomal protein L7/L12 [bacterium]|nr:50S ribosomal protein L7/L12 [bacterium]
MTEEIKNEEVQTEAVEAKEETAPVEEVKTEEAPKEEAKEEAPKKAEPTGKFKDLITSIEGLTALELADLVKELEERFGVSAAAPVAMVGGAAPAAGGAQEAGEEKTSFTVVLAAAGDQKINVIKAVREINPELGLKEAKDIVDEAPKEIKQNVKKEEAEEAKAKLEAAGATVELK